MDWEGVLYGAVFLILVTPLVCYLWRQIDRIGNPPLTADGKIDIDARLTQHGCRMNPAWEEHERRIEADGADYYRERFRKAPVGKWSAYNQESMLMGSYWTFRPDHTGEVLQTEAFGYPRERTLFQWREADDFAIEALVTDRQACVSCEPNGEPVWGADPDWEDEEDPTPNEWKRIDYDFRVVERPVRTVVMHCRGHEEFFGLGCWPLAPLEWNLPLDRP